MSRPFGVALLVAGWDAAGPVLYHTDPSGAPLHGPCAKCSLDGRVATSVREVSTATSRVSQAATAETVKTAETNCMFRQAQLAGIWRILLNAFDGMSRYPSRTSETSFCAPRRCAGTYVRYHAKAIGSGSEGAQSGLQEGFRPDLTLAEAEVLALSTLKQVGAALQGSTCTGSVPCCG